MLNQLIIPKLLFFFILNPYLVDVVLILWGEIHLGHSRELEGQGKRFLKLNCTVKWLLWVSLIIKSNFILYLHNVTCCKCGTASPACLAVNIHAVLVLVHFFNEFNSFSKHLLGRCIIKIHCSQVQLSHSPTCPFLSPKQNTGKALSCFHILVSNE